MMNGAENIQGDERDVMFFSITFCRDAAGKLPMTFGAINGSGGERRLNVAVTRARRELKVFSGIRADDIDLGRSKAVGVAHLKAFLDYAVRGAIALPAQDTGSQGDMESPFEMAVAEQLELRGWRVVPQVGVSGFRIDLGVRHPDHAGLYLAGVECDGATYHSSATARDRDKVREQVLCGLGWTILRVWSTDWWFNTAEAIERLHQSLEDALAKSRAASADATVTQSDTPETAGTSETLPDADEIEPIAADPSALSRDADVESPRNAAQPNDTPFSVQTNAHPTLGERQVASSGGASSEPIDGTFAAADLSAIKAAPDRFFEDSYRPIIQAMVDRIIEEEAPVREDILAQRIARAHGWLRTGARIRDQITPHLRALDRTNETTGTFLWKRGTATPRIQYRAAISPEHRRSLADISIAELVDFVFLHPAVIDEDDPPLIYARLMLVDRLAAPSRERIVEAIARARTLGL